MAIPAIFNINYYRGDTYKFTVKPLDQEGKEVALNGDVAFYIADVRGTPETSVECGAQIVGNTIECTITEAESTQLIGTNWVYDVQYTDTSTGDVSTYLTGNLTITEDVSP